MIKLVRNTTLLVVAFAALAATPGEAAYLLDTGLTTATPNYDDNVNYTLSPSQSLAAYVTFGSAVTINSIEGFINSGFPATATVSILGDGALPAGSSLFSASFATNVGDGYSGTFGNSWSLAAGGYWIVFETTEGLGMWNIAANPVSNYAFSSTFSGVFAWYPQSSLNVAIRIGGGDAAAVPEPASWMMLIGGFALTGAALRRRRTAIRFA